MFDFLRVAGLATLALGAAGASGQVPEISGIAYSAPVVATEPLPATPPTLPFPEDVRTRAAQEAVEAIPAAEPDADESRAASLAELVRRNATMQAADGEQNCLATAVYFESKGEPLEGQLAVARVIMNRVESGRFASTLCGVVRQPGQFSFVRGGAMPPVARDSGNWRTAVAIARIAQGDLWNSPTGNALYFHARRVAPGWRMARVGAIGNHVFYR